MKKATGTFQQTVNLIYSAVKRKRAFVHLNDVVLFSKTVKINMAHIEKFISLLDKASVMLKLKYRAFHAKAIKYFGRVICPGRPSGSRIFQKDRTKTTETKNTYQSLVILKVLYRFSPFCWKWNIQSSATELKITENDLRCSVSYRVWKRRQWMN